MDNSGEAPRYDHGYYMGSFLASSELLPQAWTACVSANASEDPFFTVDEDERVIIALKGPLVDCFNAFKDGGHFGEFEINSENDGFFGFLEDGALVHKGLFQSFLHVWLKSGIQTQVVKAVEQKKIIVLTGHSLAGATASFATLSVLEKYGRTVSIFCATFGSPLLGDYRLGQAIRKRGWDSKFCHVVLVHDILPRLLLAPTELIHEPMEALLPYWSRTMMGGNNESNIFMGVIPLSEQRVVEFYSVVLQHVCALVTLVTHSNPGDATSTNMTGKSVINSVFNLSPYRSFGNFLFCSRNGAVCIENHEVVLQLLYFVLESSDGSLDRASMNWIWEHTDYGNCFARIINGRMRSGITDLAVHHELPEATPAITIALQLEALGLGVQNVRAQLAFHEVGADSMRLSININKQIVELSKAQKVMAELEWYKRCCNNDDIGYYDAFKQQKDRKDFRANINRGKLATFWDEFIRMLENSELPPDLESRKKWVYSATAYRQLVEPLDIAYHYRHDRHGDSQHYLSSGRPRRYKIIQKWFEDKLQSEKEVEKLRTRPASLTQDSCFWAYFEEVNLSLENFTADSMAKLREFENRVIGMTHTKELSSEVFLEKSSFMQWWKKMLPAEYKLTSPLYPLMEGGWIQYSI